MKAFVFKAYDTFVGFQLSGSSTIYPKTHWKLEVKKMQLINTNFV